MARIMTCIRCALENIHKWDSDQVTDDNRQGNRITGIISTPILPVTFIIAPGSAATSRVPLPFFKNVIGLLLFLC